MGSRHQPSRICDEQIVTLNLKVPLTFKAALKRHALARGTTMTRILIEAVAALDREPASSIGSASADRSVGPQ